MISPKPSSPRVGGTEVIDLDFTRVMLDIAKHKAQRLRRLASSASPTYIQKETTPLPFEDVRFDVLAIAFGLCNVSDHPRTERVSLRAAQPAPAMGQCRLYCSRIMPWAATLIARDRSGAYRYLPRSVKSFIDRDAICKVIENAGFTNVKMTPLTFSVTVACTAERR